jgi:hypothetical protein
MADPDSTLPAFLSSDAPIRVRLAWVAGFLEGEGSFSARPNGALMIRASQVQLAPLQWLREILGGAIYPVKPAKACNLPAWSWNAGDIRAAGIAMMLYSFMSLRRREQIRAALGRWRARPPQQRHRATCPRGHRYDGTRTGLMRNGKRYVSRLCLRCRREHRRRRMRADYVSPGVVRNWHQRLTVEEVLKIRAAWPEMGQHALGRAFGVSYSTIHHVVHRLTWRHVP